MALIKCPECNHDVSDKATICVNCGFPIAEMIANGNDSDKAESSEPAEKKKKHFRSANGTGHITKLSGNRRKPYAVRIITEYRKTERGKITPSYKYIGYSETKEGATAILEQYNKEKNKVSKIHEKKNIKERINESKKVYSVKEELKRVDNMDGHRFEKWCGNLLSLSGFEKVEITVASGDKGVDILAEKDGIKYAIQCKRFNKPLTNKPVQEIGVGKDYYRRHVGVVMTNSTFTKGAQDLANETGVLLWDRTRLIELLKEYGEPEE